MNADRWGQLTDSVRDFLDLGIRRILGGVTVDPITGYEYIFRRSVRYLSWLSVEPVSHFFFEVYESIYTMSSGGRKPRSAWRGGKRRSGKHRKRKVLKERESRPGFFILRGSGFDRSSFLVHQQLRSDQFS